MPRLQPTRPRLSRLSRAVRPPRTTGLSWPPGSIHYRPNRVQAERLGRVDVVVAVVLAVVVLVAAMLLWRISPAANTVDRVAAQPIAAPPKAALIPAAFVPAWRAPSGATVAPIVAGSAVITADGPTVSGRNALAGTVAWSYTRDRPLCTVAAGFPTTEGRRGRVLTLYEGDTGFCSEMTALRPDTGARVAARNTDVVPGTELLADDTFVVATGESYLEVVRSDLVKTLEYGAVIAPAQPDRQPRVGCVYSSTTLAARRLAVIERCPEDATDRLTVLSPDPADAEKPEEEFSVLLPVEGASVVAVSTERVAVALPNPPRLELLDRTGAEISQVPLDVPEIDLSTDPPGGVAQTASGTGSDDLIFWWTGSHTVALDPVELTPRWSLPGTLGPAQSYGGGLLMPVPDGLLDVDSNTGTALRTIPVPREDRSAPVRLAASGEILLEQRGAEVVALRPSGL